METVEIKCRCKDCKSSEKVNGYTFLYCYDWQYEPGSEPNRVEPDDFCSYADFENS